MVLEWSKHYRNTCKIAQNIPQTVIPNNIFSYQYNDLQIKWRESNTAMIGNEASKKKHLISRMKKHNTNKHSHNTMYLKLPLVLFQIIQSDLWMLRLWAPYETISSLTIQFIIHILINLKLERKTHTSPHKTKSRNIRIYVSYLPKSTSIFVFSFSSKNYTLYCYKHNCKTNHI